MILSEDVAFHLQFITFPLELIGIVLALIEIRFPSLAISIAKYIHAETSAEASDLGQTITRGQLAVFSIGGIAFLVILFFAPNPHTIVAGMVVVSAVVLVSFTISVKWIPGRTVGTLGVLVASFGLVGETYQVIFQISSVLLGT